MQSVHHLWIKRYSQNQNSSVLIRHNVRRINRCPNSGLSSHCLLFFFCFSYPFYIPNSNSHSHTTHSERPALFHIIHHLLLCLNHDHANCYYVYHAIPHTHKYVQFVCYTDCLSSYLYLMIKPYHANEFVTNSGWIGHATGIDLAAQMIRGHAVNHFAVVIIVK